MNCNPDPAVMAFHRSAQGITYDDSRAEKEWRWKPVFSLAGMVGDFYEELEAHPEWYR